MHEQIAEAYLFEIGYPLALIGSEMRSDRRVEVKQSLFGKAENRCGQEGLRDAAELTHRAGREVDASADIGEPGSTGVNTAAIFHPHGNARQTKADILLQERLILHCLRMRCGGIAGSGAFRQGKSFFTPTGRENNNACQQYEPGKVFHGCLCTQNIGLISGLICG